MNILILTGPAAAGKNTISNILAKKREKCAVIDVDMVRWMYRQPYIAPWEDAEEGKEQQKFGVENACLLAQNFIKKGLDVILLDVVVDETAKLYREQLPDAKIVLLLPTFEEAHSRFLNRHKSILEKEFKIVYDWQMAFTDYDEKIDNTNLSVEETVEKLQKFFK